MISRVMLGLDLTDTDKHLIRFCVMLHRQLAFEKIYCIHALKDLENPFGLDPELLQLNKPVDETLREEISGLLDQYDDLPDGLFDIEVKEGDPTSELLHWSHIKQTDLVMVGRKSEQKGSGLIPAKLARKANSHILMVPENPPAHLRNIVLAFDFSSSAELALKQALELKQQIPGIRIHCLHIFDLPIIQYSLENAIFEPHSEEAFDKAKKDRLKKWEHIVQAMGSKAEELELIVLRDTRNNIAWEILHYARHHEIDLVIMGSKGRSNSLVSLLGNVTEKVASYNDFVPLLITKSQRENTGLLQSLFG